MAYDSTPDCTRLLAEHPQRFTAYLIDGRSAHADVARAVECEVFGEYFGNNPKTMDDQYGAYEDASLFLLVVDCEHQRPAGVLRVIRHSPVGLKTLSDLATDPLRLPVERVVAHHGLHLPSTWDVGTLAVRKAYRGGAYGHIVSTTLYGLLHVVCRARGIEHLVTVLDDHAYRQLTEFLAVPFVAICDSPPFSYLGVPGTHATYLHVPSVAPSATRHTVCLAASNPQLLAIIAPLLRRVAYGEGLPALTEVG